MTATGKDTDGVVADDERLIRHFLPNQWSHSDGRISSMAFSLRRGEAGISVDRELLITVEDSVAQACAREGRSFGAVTAITAEVRQLGLEVEADPIDLFNRAHALIKAPDGNMGKGRRRKLAELFQLALEVVQDAEDGTGTGPLAAAEEASAGDG